MISKETLWSDFPKLERKEKRNAQELSKTNNLIISPFTCFTLASMEILAQLVGKCASFAVLVFV